MDQRTLTSFLKGKITEFVVAEMFKEGLDEIVINLGYEHTTPELTEYYNHPLIMQATRNIRTAPDLVLIPKDNSKAYLVEIKYTSNFQRFNMEEAVGKISNFWENVYLLLATQEKFYYDSCTNIQNNNFIIPPLRIISSEIQEKYLKVLKSFISS